MYKYKLYTVVIYTFMILTVNLLVIILVKNNERCTVHVKKKGTKYYYITIKYYDKSTIELIHTSEVPWH